MNIGKGLNIKVIFSLIMFINFRRNTYERKNNPKLNNDYLCFTCGERPEEVEDREIKKNACPRAKKLMQEFYDAKISLDTTFLIGTLEHG